MKNRCEKKQASRARTGNRTLLSALLILFSSVVSAEIRPDTGTLMSQMPALKLSPIPAFRLKIEQNEESQANGGAPFLVKRLEINGNTLFDKATLLALVADVEGQNLTLAQLAKKAVRISAFYLEHGYKMTRAIIPTQMIADGRVRIQVIEARYGQITVQNQGRVSDALLQTTLAPLQTGQVVEEKQLDRVLLLVSDIPGTDAKASLKPGGTTGTTDMLLNARAVPLVNGFIAVDNNGNAYTGTLRVNSSMNVVAPWKQGDILSLGGLSSGRNMNYASLSYKLLLNGKGTGLGGSYSRLHYRLGGALTDADGQGDAAVANLWVRQPLLRSPTASLYGQIQLEQLQLRDHLLTDTIRTDRRLRNNSVSLTGDSSDQLLSGGSNYLRLDWLNGRVQFLDQTAERSDAALAQTNGHFAKTNFRLSRLQKVGQNDSLSVEVSGQWASTNLDAAQKMSVGGPTSVRAYDAGALSADIGALGTIEWRHDFGSAWGGKIQSAVFIDGARISINKQPWLNAMNTANLRGVGLALNWTWQEQWQARLQLARQLGTPPEQVINSAPSRIWAEFNRNL